MDALELHQPFTGPCLVQNSPANRVPSHGTDAFASAWAIDLVPLGDDGRTAPFVWESLWRPEPPARFPGFGRPVLSPVDGQLVLVYDDQPDHPSQRGFPSLTYALTQRSRAAQGWHALAGNHVLIRSAVGPFVALCHLQQGSAGVVLGQAVAAGEVVAACGNSGNSTEPHLHLQAMDHQDPTRARAVPITFDGGLPRNGTRT